MGVVEVVVVSARDLTRKDFISNNDAFVDIWLSDKTYKQRTSVVQSATPLWNQTFTFNYEGGDRIVHFHVLDKDLIGTDGIGYSELDFGHLHVGQTESKELVLKANLFDLTPNGYLTVAITKRS
ncbi:hypothetical protein HK405_007577 [Cladochytrium tenue]|nr:hypothetical protein HK405_007577 [Cladochytrium tenue]